MAKCYLAHKAIEDLSNIWNYTFDTWSESQADKYYQQLLADCHLLAANQNLGKHYPEIRTDVYGFKSGQHIIFYRIKSKNEIEVVRFLHSRMDLKKRIIE